MTYTVNYTDGNKTPISVVQNGVDTTTNIGLVGRNYKNYGEVIAEDLLHLLENFASGSAPAKPVEGQLWYDSNNNQLKYLDDTVANSGNWKALANILVQTSEPSGVGEKDGDLWLDSGSGVLYTYYNGNWIVVSDITGDTQIVARTRYDTNDVTHKTSEIIVNGEIVSITSSDMTAWTPQNNGGVNTEYLEDGVTMLSTQFSSISPGINLNETAGYVFSGTATSALYADLAERYHADREYQYGTVVEIGGEKEVTQTTIRSSTSVFGIVSDNPAVMMNSGAGSDATHPYVALSGRVPVRIIGKVKKGDRLVSSSVPGHAQASDVVNPDWTTVIGRALEDKINQDAGIIEAVVGTK